MWLWHLISLELAIELTYALVKTVHWKKLDLSHNLEIQWKRSIMDTFGEQCFGLYTEVAFVEGLFCSQTVHLGPGFLAVI